MEIDVYSKYNVHYFSKSSYLNEEEEFEENTTVRDKVLEGGELLDRIGNLFKERYLIKFKDQDDLDTYLEFENFNPDTGEGSKIIITYERVKEE